MFDLRWLGRNKGQGMVEYILIIVVVVAIVLAGYKIFGGRVKQAFVTGGERIDIEANAFTTT